MGSVGGGRAALAVGDDRGPLLAAGIFIVLIACFESAVAILVRTGALLSTMEGTAIVTGALANATGVPATVSRGRVFLEGQILTINAECIGVYLFGAYLALVLASPAPPRAKLRGSILGVLVIGAVNFARLLLVVHVSSKSPGLLPFVHDYLFEVGMIAVVLAAWAVWIGEVKKNAT